MLVSLMVGPAAAYLTNVLIERQKAKREKESQERQNEFSIGVTSHMAQVAFDKHVGFCEKYIRAVSEALQVSAQQEDWSEPPTLADLVTIRRKWTIWLDDDLEDHLEKFERALVSPAWTFDPAGARLSNVVHVRTLVKRLRKLLHVEELVRRRDESMSRSSTSG